MSTFYQSPTASTPPPVAGMTALAAACANRAAADVEALLSHGASTDVLSTGGPFTGCMPLGIAAMQADAPTMAALLAHARSQVSAGTGPTTAGHVQACAANGMSLTAAYALAALQKAQRPGQQRQQQLDWRGDFSALAAAGMDLCGADQASRMTALMHVCRLGNLDCALGLLEAIHSSCQVIAAAGTAVTLGAAVICITSCHRPNEVLDC